MIIRRCYAKWDEDQSIYGFRAAYPEALLDFEKDHPSAKVLVMDQNYRSNAKIVAAADLFIQHNKARHDKHMQPTKDAGSDINFVELKTRSNQYGYLLKVAANCNRETAVLYRDNVELMKIMEKPLLKVGFVQIGEGYDFATDLQSLDHNAMERDIEAVFTGRYFGYNYE